MRRKNIISLAVYLATFAVAMFIPLTASATNNEPPLNLNVTKGIVHINAKNSGCVADTTDPNNKGYCNGHIIVMDEDADAEDNHSIEIVGNSPAGVGHKVILKDVAISTSNGATFKITGKAKVLLILDGTNTLESGTGCAGLQVDSESSVTIISKDGSTDNSLTTQGGDNGAGIGGQAGIAHGSITIKGGTINATGGVTAAGIGCGKGGGLGDITIEGGVITAQGGGEDIRPTGKKIPGGAGIGYYGHVGPVTSVGSTGGSGKITLSGGNITASGGSDSDSTNGYSYAIDCKILDSGVGGSTDIVTNGTNLTNNGIAPTTNKDGFSGIVWDKSATTLPRNGYIYGNASLKENVREGEIFYLYGWKIKY